VEADENKRVRLDQSEAHLLFQEFGGRESATAFTAASQSGSHTKNLKSD
jgi:hypothetical protein